MLSSETKALGNIEISATVVESWAIFAGTFTLNAR